MSELKDPRAEATAYLTQHSVLPLFNSLGTKLMYSKPEDPNAFLLNELKAIQSANKSSKGPASGALIAGTGATSFFTAGDVSTMFGMLDPTGSGTITSEQYGNALKSFGVNKQTVDVVKGEGGRIGKEAFEKAIWAELKKV